jgi:hypothetical protein
MFGVLIKTGSLSPLVPIAPVPSAIKITGAKIPYSILYKIAVLLNGATLSCKCIIDASR